MENNKVVDELIDAHWDYLKGVLAVHGDEELIGIVEYHYKSAFKHGWKHGVEHVTAESYPLVHLVCS